MSSQGDVGPQKGRCRPGDVVLYKSFYPDLDTSITVKVAKANLSLK